MRHIAKHLPTSISRLVWQQEAHLAKCDSAAAPEARVVRSYAVGLHAQREAAEAVGVNLSECRITDVDHY